MEDKELSLKEHKEYFPGVEIWYNAIPEPISPALVAFSKVTPGIMLLNEKQVASIPPEWVAFELKRSIPEQEQDLLLLNKLYASRHEFYARCQ